jgi:2-oxoglutarate ferredoxin oxidoreductase subunit beta
VEIERLVAAAMKKKGFSLVEIISQCPVYFGRLNDMDTPVEMLREFRDTTSTDDVEGKLRRGILVNRRLPEYWDEYQRILIPSVTGASK